MLYFTQSYTQVHIHLQVNTWMYLYKILTYISEFFSKAELQQSSPLLFIRVKIITIGIGLDD